MTTGKNTGGVDRRSGAGLRLLLASGLATAFATGLAGSAAAYESRWFADPALAARPAQTLPVSWKRKRAHSRRWQAAEPSKTKGPEKLQGPLELVISIKSQKITLYANGEPAGTSIISTGVPGHATPMGVFSVIEKDRYHHSNIYSGAPMPYMQRITWSGVALHEGFVTGRPASHGCIRLPQAFAQRLWAITQVGVRVIIAPEDVSPVAIADTRLFAMKQKSAPVAAAEPDPVPAAKIRLATNAEVTDSPTLPAVTSTAEPAAADPVAAQPTDDTDPLANGPALTEMIRAEQAKEAAEQAKAAEAERAAEIAAAKAGKLDKSKLAATAKQYPERPGPITVFISRSLGKLFVRKGFWPVFETPVTIAQPDRPFGTHVFTALESQSDGGALRWNVVTLPNASTVPAPPPLTRWQRRHGMAQPQQRETARAAADPADVLGRITIPDEARDRISELMTPGASLIISDLGISHETNRGTDFIILTR